MPRIRFRPGVLIGVGIIALVIVFSVGDFLAAQSRISYRWEEERLPSV